MIKLFILGWSILANSLGAHAVAQTIEKPLVQNVSSTQIEPKSASDLIGILPIPKSIPVLKTSEKPDIRSYSYLTYDSDSAAVLLEKNGYTKRPQASTAKLMTALLTMELGKTDDIVTVSHAAAMHPGSTMGLREGEHITTKNLLYGLLLNSGNDAATALAEQYGGGQETFINKMNTRATELGLTQSHFAEPAGYDEENTVLSSFDLAKLMKLTLANPVLSEIFLTKDITVSDTNGKITHSLTTSNRLVKNDYAGILGGKTGTGTFDKNKAGHVLVAAAKRNNHTIIVVISNTYDNLPDASAREAAKLLDFVFTNL